MWKQFEMENSEKLIDAYAIGGVGTEKSVPIDFLASADCLLKSKMV